MVAIVTCPSQKSIFFDFYYGADSPRERKTMKFEAILRSLVVSGCALALILA